MRPIFLRASTRFFILAVLLLSVAACGGGKTKPDTARSTEVPSSFDVTVHAQKDGQFDYNDVPLTSQDLRDALRYRKEQGQPMATLLLKRSEKQSVKDAHVVVIARLSVELGFKAWVEEKNAIDEIRTTTKGE